MKTLPAFPATSGEPGRASRRHSPLRSCAGLFAAVWAAAALSLPAQNEAQPPADPAAPEPAAAAANPPESNPAAAPSAPTDSTEAMIPPGDTGGTNGLRLNFRNAPIDLVLNYLSEAAGFIIELDTNVRGTVSVISSHPMTKDEAVDLVNSVLNKNGYAAIRNGRTLKIMDKSTAKSSNNPVKISNDPESIPNNDEMVTQIIPIRYVEASQLVTDLSPFVSPDARIIANQAGNSIVITDTQANIRHLVEIIKAIDSSAEDINEVKVFHLRYADPTEMATLLTGLFPDQSTSAQAPLRFAGGGRGGRGGFPFGPFGGNFGGANAASTGNSQTDRIKKRNQVVAVADARTSSVVVTATRDLMEQITEMIERLDNPSPKAQRVAVIPMSNADAQQVLPVLQDMFQGTTARSSRNSANQNSQLQNRIQQNQNSSRSTGIGTGTGTGIGTGRGSTGVGTGGF